MSLPSLASACILGLLLALPPAAALDLAQGPARVSARGVCLTLGDPPGSDPDVALGGCGPKVIVRVATPAGTVEKDLGPCETDCGLIVFVDIVLCSDPGMPESVSGPRNPLDAEGGLDAETILLEVEDRLRSLHVNSLDDAVEMETFLSCD